MLNPYLTLDQAEEVAVAYHEHQSILNNLDDFAERLIKADRDAKIKQLMNCFEIV